MALPLSLLACVSLLFFTFAVVGENTWSCWSLCSKSPVAFQSLCLFAFRKLPKPIVLSMLASSSAFSRASRVGGSSGRTFTIAASTGVGVLLAPSAGQSRPTCMGARSGTAGWHMKRTDSTPNWPKFLDLAWSKKGCASITSPGMKIYKKERLSVHVSTSSIESFRLR
jgi:hypothetical protein